MRNADSGGCRGAGSSRMMRRAAAGWGATDMNARALGTASRAVQAPQQGMPKSGWSTLTFGVPDQV